MILFRIIITQISLIHLAFSKKDDMSIKVIKTPNFLIKLLNVEKKSPLIFRTLISSGGIIDHLSMETDMDNRFVKVSDDISKKVGRNISDIFLSKDLLNQNLLALFGVGSIMRRVEERKPFVELAPGTIKTEIIKYPPNYLQGRLLYLLKLKKKQQQNED